MVNPATISISFLIGLIVVVGGIFVMTAPVVDQSNGGSLEDESSEVISTLVTLQLQEHRYSPPEEVAFDGERYFYAFAFEDYVCEIIRIDPIALLENAPFESAVKIWPTDLDCKVGPGATRGVGYDDGFVWVATNQRKGGTIAKFDLMSEKFASLYRVPEGDVGGSIRIDEDGSVYVASGLDYIIKVDESADPAISYIQTGPCSALVGFDASCWVRDLYLDTDYIYFTGKTTPGVGRVHRDGSGLEIFTNSRFHPDDNSPIRFTDNGVRGTYRIVKGPDGKFWFSVMSLPAIGSLDPITGSVTLHDLSLPNGSSWAFHGPRGLTFDHNGQLWIAGGTLEPPTGRIMTLLVRLDPSTGLIQASKIPGEFFDTVQGPLNGMWVLEACCKPGSGEGFLFSTTFP